MGSFHEYAFRSIPHYLRPSENTVIREMSCADVTGAKILIIVKSAPRNGKLRQNTRDTYAKFTKKYSKVRKKYIT